jgi:hypothetical protein
LQRQPEFLTVAILTIEHRVEAVSEGQWDKEKRYVRT